MAYGYSGSTPLDIMTSLAVVLLIAATAVLASGPTHVLAQKQDDRREREVQQLMQAVLSLQFADAGALANLERALTDAGPEPRIMLGGAADCAGDWGAECADALLADHCVDSRPYLGDYLTSIPFDHSSDRYSERQTGYYLSLDEARNLTVGACNPAGIDPIFVTRELVE